MKCIQAGPNRHRKGLGMERLVDPLTTTDAKLWADEFMKVKARLGEQKFDHAMMLGWFANAIMQGYDEGQRRAKADAQATVEALQQERDEYARMWRDGCNDRGAAHKEIEELTAALDAEREKVKGLEKWRINVTAALLRPGGAFYEDVPKHVKEMAEQLSALQALVRALKGDANYTFPEKAGAP